MYLLLTYLGMSNVEIIIVDNNINIDTFSPTKNCRTHLKADNFCVWSPYVRFILLDSFYMYKYIANSSKIILEKVLIQFV